MGVCANGGMVCITARSGAGPWLGGLADVARCRELGGPSHFSLHRRGGPPALAVCSAGRVSFTARHSNLNARCCEGFGGNYGSKLRWQHTPGFSHGPPVSRALETSIMRSVHVEDPGRSMLSNRALPAVQGSPTPRATGSLDPSERSRGPYSVRSHRLFRQIEGVQSIPIPPSLFPTKAILSGDSRQIAHWRHLGAGVYGGSIAC